MWKKIKIVGIVVVGSGFGLFISVILIARSKSLFGVIGLGLFVVWFVGVWIIGLIFLGWFVGVVGVGIRGRCVVFEGLGGLIVGIFKGWKIEIGGLLIIVINRIIALGGR